MIDVVAVVVVLTPRCAGSSDEGAGVRFVLKAAEHRKRCTREHAFVAADLAEGLRHVGKSPPRVLESLPHVARAFLQRLSRDLLGIGTRVRESDGDLEGPGADSDLGADRHVSWARAVVGVRQPAIAVI